MELLTVAQAASRLGVRPQLVYSLCAARKLRHCRLGNGRGVIRIPAEAIEEYLRGVTIPAGEEPEKPATKKVSLKYLRF